MPNSGSAKLRRRGFEGRSGEDVCVSARCPRWMRLVVRSCLATHRPMRYWTILTTTAVGQGLLGVPGLELLLLEGRGYVEGCDVWPGLRLFSCSRDVTSTPLSLDIATCQAPLVSPFHTQYISETASLPVTPPRRDTASKPSPIPEESKPQQQRIASAHERQVNVAGARASRR